MLDAHFTCIWYPVENVAKCCNMQDVRTSSQLQFWGPLVSRGLQLLMVLARCITATLTVELGFCAVRIY